MSSPISRRSIGASPRATSERSSTTGSSRWRRENASSWRVSSVARTAARSIASSSEAPLPVADQRPGELAVAGDDRQQVVEVVRDPARELADGLHLLRLAQLLLEPPLLRHVARDHAARLDHAVVVADRERRVGEVDRLAVLAPRHRLALDGLPALERGEELVHLRRLRAGVREGHDRAPGDLGGLVAERPLGALVPREHGAVGLEGVDRVRGALDDRRQPPHRPLGVAPAGDVAGDQREAGDLALRVADRRRRGLGGEAPAVAAHVDRLVVDRAPGHQLRPDLGHPLAPLRRDDQSSMWRPIASSRG